MMLALILLMSVVSAGMSLYLFSGKGPEPLRLRRYEEYPLLNRSYRLLLTMLSGTLLVSTVLALLFHTPKLTTAGYMLYTMNIRNVLFAGSDSWLIMFTALDELRANPMDSLYDTVFFFRLIKFQYPLSSLLFFDFAQQAVSVPWRYVEIAMNFLSWLGLVAMGYMCYYLLAESAARYDEHQAPFSIAHSKMPGMPFLVISMASVYLFYPLTKSFQLGQIQTLISCFAALALIAWSRERKILSGIIIGFCCSFKPQWGVVLLWALFRKEWRFSSAILFAAGIFQIVSVMKYGLGNCVDYIEVLRYISSRGESYAANQSVNGLMHRLLFSGNNLEWQAGSFAPYNPVVYYTTVASSAIILGVALFWRVRRRPRLLDLSLIFVSSTIASPVAWEHHYGILLPIFCMALPTAIARRPFGDKTVAYLLIVYFLISQNLDSATALLANTYLNFMQSYLFFGAVAVLILLYKLLSIESESDQMSVN